VELRAAPLPRNANGKVLKAELRTGPEADGPPGAVRS